MSFSQNFCQTMWKTFMFDDNIYLLKLDSNSNSENYKIFLTNLSKIWLCQLSKELFVQKFLDCNPLIEVETEEASKQALNLLKKIDSAEVLLNFSDSCVKVTIKSDLSDFIDTKIKIKYELEFTKSENDMFTNTITVPLVQTVMLLEKQQNMMKNLLIKKDRELEEYELEKGLISRNDLITEKFEPEIVISSSNKLLLNIFGKIEDSIIRKFGDIEEKVAEVDVEMWNNVKKKRKIYNKHTAEKVKNVKIVYKGTKDKK